jgi:hypothetical protein
VPNVEVTPALVALWPNFVSYLVTFISLGPSGSVITSYTTPSGAPTELSSLAQHLLFYVRLAAPVFDQPPERFPRGFIAPLFFGANLAVIGWIPFFQWTYVNSRSDMLADFASAEYRKE